MVNTIDQTLTELAPLLTKIVNEIKTNDLSVSEVSNLFSQLIEEKRKVGISNSEMTSFLAQIMGDTKKNKITAAEVSNLWTQYLSDSMSICINQYFLNIVEDKELQSIIEFAMQLSQNHITKITEFFNQENFKVPHGFTKQDVNLKAPRLFSDPFIAFYTEIMATHGLAAYSLAITTCDREDIQNYFIGCTITTSELYRKVFKYRKNKGEFTPVSSIPPLEHIEFVEKTGLISNLLGDKRPLNASEINNLFFNTKKNTLNEALATAFSQVAETEDVRNIGRNISKAAGGHIRAFTNLLENEGLLTPRLWGSEVTKSTVSPFSDKLMMFHLAFLESAALAFYGAGLASSLRSDVALIYDKIFSDIHGGGRKIFDVLVKHGWLEKQPEAINREELAQGKTE